MRFLWVLLAAVASVHAAGSALACELPAAGAAKLELRAAKPVTGDDVVFISGFGIRLHPLLLKPRMHAGIDWAAPQGATVIAAAGGQVIEAGPRGEYGNAILVDHGGGWHTLYAQLSRFAIQNGDCVAAGTVIAYVGSTGLSSGPHLHFEVRQDGKPLDPLLFRAQGEPPQSDGEADGGG